MYRKFDEHFTTKTWSTPVILGFSETEIFLKQTDKLKKNKMQLKQNKNSVIFNINYSKNSKKPPLEIISSD